MEIHGTCKEGFEAVRDAFERNFGEGLEVGAAAAAVTVDGESVVDIWAGDADTNGNPVGPGHDRERVLHHQDHGGDVHARLGRSGRAGTSMRRCASTGPSSPRTARRACWCGTSCRTRRACPGLLPPVSAEDLYDLDAIAERLAAQELWWEPGTKIGLPHAVTQGQPSRARFSTASPASAWRIGSAPKSLSRSARTSG